VLLTLNSPHSTGDFKKSRDALEWVPSHFLIARFRYSRSIISGATAHYEPWASGGVESCRVLRRFFQLWKPFRAFGRTPWRRRRGGESQGLYLHSTAQHTHTHTHTKRGNNSCLELESNPPTPFTARPLWLTREASNNCGVCVREPKTWLARNIL
jgi:hypothetical protein